MRNVFGRLGFALVIGLIPTSAMAFQDQWQPSSRSLAEYVADGYTMAQPAVRQLTPFSRTEFRYYLTKGSKVAQCTEAITVRKSAVIDKVLACEDLVAPFAR